MRSLSDTARRLAALRGAATSQRADAQGNGRLIELHEFGSNPGALRAHIYRPPGLAPGSPLIVVLHGCTQTAAGYDVGAGWSEMADRHGFTLLFPEQRRENNANLCFNWFVPEDQRRGSGEALSIREMVAAVVERDRIEPARVYVTGLSAGGAMAAVMLATYPEVFAGGAIIAGLPYGSANTIPQAFDRMRGHGVPAGEALGALVRGASDHRGAWPTISVWHGDDDATVSPVNADALIAQWRALHGVAAVPSRSDVVDGVQRRLWCDASGRPVIEDVRVAGMGHGTPLDTQGEDGCGRSGAYMIEARISSTHHICRFWGLIGETAASAPQREGNVTAPSRTLVPVTTMAQREEAPTSCANESPGSGVGKVIEDALRAAGLMR